MFVMSFIQTANARLPARRGWDALMHGTKGGGHEIQNSKVTKNRPWTIHHQGKQNYPSNSNKNK